MQLLFVEIAACMKTMAAAEHVGVESATSYL